MKPYLRRCNLQYPAYEVKIKGPHDGFHWDEVLEDAVAEVYGNRLFLGIATAEVRPGAYEGTELEQLQQGTLVYGQCQGYFDDKGPDGKRLENTCAALRMAEYLGVENNMELVKPLVATLDGDQGGSNRPLAAGALVRNAVNSTPTSEHPKVFIWARKAADAIIGYQVKLIEARKGGGRFECLDFVQPADVFQALIKKRADAKDPIPQPIVLRMRGQISGSNNQIEHCLELAHIARAMAATGVSKEAAAVWINSALEYTVQVNCEYRRATAFIHGNGGKDFPLPKGWQGLLVSPNDNAEVGKASRSSSERAGEHGFAVCVTRSRSGNVAVLLNVDAKIDPKGIRALIRLQELLALKPTMPEDKWKEAVGSATFEGYSVPGNHASAPHWHMTEEGNCLNGSLGRLAPASKLKDDIIVLAVRLGIEPDKAQACFDRIKGMALGEAVVQAPVSVSAPSPAPRHEERPPLREEPRQQRPDRRDERHVHQQRPEHQGHRDGREQQDRNGRHQQPRLSGDGHDDRRDRQQPNSRSQNGGRREEHNGHSHNNGHHADIGRITTSNPRSRAVEYFEPGLGDLEAALNRVCGG